MGPWINGWVNNREAGDLRRYRGHYDVIVMKDMSKLDLYHKQYKTQQSTDRVHNTYDAPYLWCAHWNTNALKLDWK